MTDQNRKTLRSFYCRDYLWELFEVMTRDLGCSMDYLVNEAMRHYARSRNYSLAAPPEPGRGSPYDSFEQPPRASGPLPPAPPVGVGRPPPLPDRRGPSMPPPAPMQQQPPMQPAPAPAPAPPMQMHPDVAARAPLFLLFNGQRYRIDKDKFVIGRGSQQTDLTIRDGNISRKHCMVMYRGGAYYIKDLESTNGIEFNGKRIEQKRVEEGDTYYLCDYELRFTYR
ncbi:MAG: FHA domain-containing protein [bacterium]|nr:FHA domain-containing protein [Myxococcales bacterium]MCB9543056.1 FHA domain-containing protein [Myxococcales bacterium]MCB9551588.1 FHA domain-containing protein [Myxococcales bacterium]